MLYCAVITKEYDNLVPLHTAHCIPFVHCSLWNHIVTKYTQCSLLCMSFIAVTADWFKWKKRQSFMSISLAVNENCHRAGERLPPFQPYNYSECCFFSDTASLINNFSGVPMEKIVPAFSAMLTCWKSFVCYYTWACSLPEWPSVLGNQSGVSQGAAQWPGRSLCTLNSAKSKYAILRI